MMQTTTQTDAFSIPLTDSSIHRLVIQGERRPADVAAASYGADVRTMIGRPDEYDADTIHLIARIAFTLAGQAGAR